MVQLEAVGWRIGDVAVMRHLRLVGTIPRGTEALDSAVEHHDAEFAHDSLRNVQVGNCPFALY